MSPRALDILADNNPFASTNLGDPWHASFPDIAEINGHVQKPLIALIRSLAGNPHSNLGILVTGESGSGKTHLIHRLKELSRDEERPFALAFVPPLTDPAGARVFLLQQLINSFRQPLAHLDGRGQLDLLAAELLAEHLPLLGGDAKIQAKLQAIQEKPLDLFKITDQLRPQHYQRLEQAAMQSLGRDTRMVGLYQPLVRALAHYVQPDNQWLAIRFLQGEEIEGDEAKGLGLPSREGAAVAALEAEAGRIILSFALLFSRRKRPVAICFDQLEVMESQDKLNAFGELTAFLVREAPGMVPVAFVRGQLWHDSIRSRLDSMARDRLADNTFDLVGCNPSQATRLVESRLEAVLGAEWKTTYADAALLLPLSHTVTAQAYRSPRQVLLDAKEKLRKLVDGDAPPPPASVNQVLADAYEKAFQDQLSSLERTAPDGDRLRKGVGLFLDNHPQQGPLAGWTFAGTSQEMLFEKEPGHHRAYFLVDVNGHHLSVLKGINRGLEYLERGDGCQVVHIRDVRRPIPAPPKWPSTNQALERFRERGGRFLPLSREGTSRCLALIDLAHAVIGGDLSMEDGGQVRPVTREELHAFIRDRVHGQGEDPFPDLTQALSGETPALPPPPPPPPPLPFDPHLLVQVANQMAEALKESPARIMTTKKLLAALEERGVKVSMDLLMAALSHDTVRFASVPSADGVMIRLRPGVKP